MVGGDEEALRLSLRKVVNEYNIQNDAYIAEIRVPKPEGIFGIPIKKGLINPFRRTITRPGFVMEWINGVTLDRLGKDYSEAHDSWRQEIEKAIDLGFEPADHLYLKNAIWNPKERQTYVIDLALWHGRGIIEKV
jgi:hypothetical protein